MTKYLPLGGVFVDVGANRGAISFPVAVQNPSSAIYSIEPVAIMLEKMRIVRDMNPTLLRNTKIVSAFLTSKERIALAEIPNEVDASWNVYPNTTSDKTTGAMAYSIDSRIALTFDALVIREGISQVDVVKIDVDGYEIDVLRGAQDSIRKFQPIIIMEWAPYAQIQRGNSPRELVELLIDYGYTPSELIWRGSKSCTWEKVLNIKPLKSKDIVFKPK